MQEQSKKECGVEEGDSLIKMQPWPQRVGLCMLASTRPWKDGAVGLSNSYLPFKRPSSVMLSSLNHPLLTLWARIYSSLRWAPTMAHVVTPLLKHGHIVLCWSLCEVIVLKTGFC